MKNLILFTMLIIVLIISSCAKPKATEEMIILCSTYPIYQFTRNITEGAKNVSVQLLISGELGCPHDYALTPQDMEKIAKAKVLVINGLGMEEFIGLPQISNNQNLKVIDTSNGITELISYLEEEDSAHHHDHHVEKHEDEHHHEGNNPHLFVSPKLAVQIVANIALGLSETDPANQDVYTANSLSYQKRLLALSQELTQKANRLANKAIVQPHGAFDYFAREMGLEIVATMQAHGAEPSAAQMKALIKKIKTHKVGAIVLEPQYPEQSGKALATESGVKLITLDPVASGDENASLSHYEDTMRRNMSILEEALGTN